MVSAEQVMLSVINGWSVSLLINATPTRSADGATGSMVVALQDPAPLEEWERKIGTICNRSRDGEGTSPESAGMRKMRSATRAMTWKPQVTWKRLR